MKGDGNCFYRCVSVWQCNHEDNHGKIRHSEVEHIATNKQLCGAYIDGNMNDHLQDQRCSDGGISSWTTEAELYATATLLQTEIFVHDGKQELKFAPLSEDQVRRHSMLI